MSATLAQDTTKQRAGERMPMKAMRMTTLRKCKSRCGRRVQTMRSKLCPTCFARKAAKCGARSAGNAKGNPGNAGNRKKGATKKHAGKRSGLKRSARYALVVKKQWLDRIFAGDKDWEIRGSSTTRRGWIHFAESQAGGMLVGRARLVNCLSIPRSSFMKHADRHCVASLSEVPYKRIFAWVLKAPERFKRPFVYKHKPGAVIWCEV